ncbi:putative poly(R)-hydroxyalkanoic acid synthase, E subunit [delta proteobacterium NaphS2]|nr:putative poly(R)-hydroxyalkanoic acid synthase, E subunit [delta proteobacterium NaphS2]
MIDLMEHILKSAEAYAAFMNAAMEAFSAGGEGADETLKDLYHHMTRRYLSFYEKSVGRILKMPQLGISRESMQQVMAATDACNRFVASMGDFLMKFNVPLKDSFPELMTIIQEREAAGDGFKSAHEIYDAAVRLLDEKYDAHIKSPEGVQMVVDVVEKYLDYKKKADVVNDIFLRSLSIPTSGEMEDVYRGIYELKRKTRQQATVIRHHESMIETLNQKLEALEARLSGVHK